jgi:hypothetical protein
MAKRESNIWSHQHDLRGADDPVASGTRPKTKKVNKPQKASKEQVKVGVREAQEAAAKLGDSETARILGPGGLSGAAPHQLGQLVSHAERSGASYGRIKGTRKVVSEQGGQRSAIIRSIPVSTDYEAIEAAFASRATQNAIWRRHQGDGGVD